MGLLLPSAIGSAAVLLVALAAGFTAFLRRAARRKYPRRAAFPVRDLRAGGKERRHSLFDPPALKLTVVIPAYREEDRIAAMLRDSIAYLESRAAAEPGFTAELLVVDDGSPDGTARCVREACAKLSPSSSLQMGLISFPRNQGKGAAISEGILAARGELVLFADADGATHVREVEKLERGLKASGGSGLACGSRCLTAEDCRVERHAVRRLLMLAFKMFVRMWGVRSVRDTQCGFKLMDRKTARGVVPSLHLDRWIFDVELIHLAEALHRPVIEVPVSWTEMGGSKLSLAVDSVSMAADLICMRLAYALHLWRIRS